MNSKNQKWSEVLCCPLCVKVFSRHKHAVNLLCSHAVCTDCIRYRMDEEHFCLTDKISGELPLSVLPKNKAMMSIVGVDLPQGLSTFIQYDDSLGPADLFMLQNIDDSLCGMVSYLRPIETERGGSIWSEVMSRTVQRKLIHLICQQLAETSGRLRAARQSRQLAERILCELMISSQHQQSLSHQLWSAVRARGCQFLGPVMQDDVLSLIHLTMSHNALIARKTLVMYVVKRMTETYPQVSKTCVGHVVQLLYRASCFNVLKRDGESSLMQLKEEFTMYDALRKEHDTQIVSIAIEAGLRIAPEQWSGLLYGDHEHRSHMQSIVDKLQTPSSFTNGIEDLRKMSEGDGLMEDTAEALRAVDDLTRTIHDDCSLVTVDWRTLRKILESLRELVDKYADVLTRRNQARSEFLQRAVSDGTDQQAAHSAACALIRPIAVCGAVERANGETGPHALLTMFKTKMCRDMPHCSRGDRCSYAHDTRELRPPGGTRRERGPPPTASRWPFVQPPTSVPAAHGYPSPQQQQVMGTPQHQLGPAPLIRPYTPAQPQMMMQQQPGAAPVLMMQSQPMMGGMQQQQQSSVQWQPQPLQPPPHVSWLPTNEMEQQTNMYWGPIPTMKSMNLSGPSELSEVEQLHMRRDEIISRLGPLSLEQDDILNGPSTSGGHPGDNDDAHVSYTVASSVLDDRISDLMQANASSVNPIIELPPMPPGYTPVINSTTTSEETLGVLSEFALGDAAGAASNASVKARTSSLTTTTTTVRTACPAYAFHTTVDGCTTATVQADCSTMHVTDTISEPVATPVIVPSYSVVLYAPAAEGAPGAVVAANGAVVAPSGAVLAPAPTPASSFETTPQSLTRDAARLPMVIQPLSQINPVQAEDPQDIVSNTLDRIVDVRERLTEVDGTASTVVKTQLEVELEIASRQIEQLDPLTTQNCLLKELEAVERKIEEIESSAPTVNQNDQPQLTVYYPQVMPMNMHGI